MTLKMNMCQEHSQAVLLKLLVLRNRADRFLPAVPEVHLIATESLRHGPKNFQLVPKMFVRDTKHNRIHKHVTSGQQSESAVYR